MSQLKVQVGKRCATEFVAVDVGMMKERQAGKGCGRIQGRAMHEVRVTNRIHQSGSRGGVVRVR